MRSKVERQSEEAEKAVRDIRRATRRQYSAEEKVRIVIAGLRGEDSVAELCRKEGINQNLYYRWSKLFDDLRHPPNSAQLHQMSVVAKWKMCSPHDTAVACENDLDVATDNLRNRKNDSLKTMLEQESANAQSADELDTSSVGERTPHPKSRDRTSKHLTHLPTR
jgi:transposase-like protein